MSIQKIIEYNNNNNNIEKKTVMFLFKQNLQYKSYLSTALHPKAVFLTTQRQITQASDNSKLYGFSTAYSIHQLHISLRVNNHFQEYHNTASIHIFDRLLKNWKSPSWSQFEAFNSLYNYEVSARYFK